MLPETILFVQPILHGRPSFSASSKSCSRFCVSPRLGCGVRCRAVFSSFSAFPQTSNTCRRGGEETCLLPVIPAKESLCAAFAKISRELTAGALQKTVYQNENGIEIDLGWLMLVAGARKQQLPLGPWEAGKVCGDGVLAIVQIRPAREGAKGW